jgi:prevent-host-death family protein
MTKWQLQDAKARFSELIDDAVERGPQIVTRRGVDTAVVVSIEDWRRTQSSERPSLKDVLLGPGPRFDIPIPKRGRGRWRKPLVFD